MKITKVYNGNFQRNGVAGVSFFSCFIDWKVDGNKYSGFLVTFETVEEDGKERIDHTLTRVIDPQNPKLSWRGDEFSYALHFFFREKLDNDLTQIYDYLKAV